MKSAKPYIATFVIVMGILLATMFTYPTSAQERSQRNPEVTAHTAENETSREQAQDRADQARDSAEQRKEEVFQKVKDRLLANIDRILAHLQTLRERVAQQSADQASALAAIDAHIAQVTNMQTQVQSSENSEELRGIGETLRGYWQSYRQSRLKYVGLHLAGRFQDFLNKVKDTANTLAEKIAVITSEHPALDLSSIQTALNDFDAAVVGAQAKINEAVALFGSINSEDTGERTFQQGMGLLREAKRELHEAHQKLRTAVQETKELLRTQTD